MNSAHSQGQKGGKVRWALNGAGVGAVDAHTLTVLWDVLDWGVLDGQGEWRAVSWRYIGQRAQVGRTTVYRVLKRYIEAGVIECTERWSRDVGARLSNAYRFSREGLIRLFSERGVGCDVLGVSAPPRPPHPRWVNSAHPHSEGSERPHSERAGRPHNEHAGRPHSAHPHSEGSERPHSERAERPHSAHPHSEGSERPHSERAERPHSAHPHSERAERPHNERAERPHNERAGRPHNEHAGRPHSARPHNERAGRPHSARPHNERAGRPHSAHPHSEGSERPHSERAGRPHTLTMSALNASTARPSHGERPATPNERPTHTRETASAQGGPVQRVQRYKPTAYPRAQGTRATGPAARLATGEVWRDPHDYYPDNERLFQRAVLIRETLSPALPHMPLLALLQDILKRWGALEWMDSLMYHTPTVEDFRRYAHGTLRRFHQEQGHAYSPEREGAFIEALINSV